MPCHTSVRSSYGVASVSRIDKIIGFFCRMSSLLQGSFAKETCNFIDPANRSHPIAVEERGVAGSDPSTRGRSPVVLEVLFHSRAISTRRIQSEIVLGYLHYLDFCTVRSGVAHL